MSGPPQHASLAPSTAEDPFLSEMSSTHGPATVRASGEHLIVASNPLAEAWAAVAVQMGCALLVEGDPSGASASHTGFTPPPAARLLLEDLILQNFTLTITTYSTTTHSPLTHHFLTTSLTMQTCQCSLHARKSRREYDSRPTTDFKNWTHPTWECFGDDDGHKCQTHWKSPEYPEPLYKPDQKKYFVGIIWPRFLMVCVCALLLATTFGPYPRLWAILLGASVTLLVQYYIELLPASFEIRLEEFTLFRDSSVCRQSALVPYSHYVCPIPTP
ncbi:hypothetical protein GE09DRAFT_1242422 [Coniochaeta sp. 2T2.1]|nr:hypothetical protein GE09DRAFT_1242422 [Coniochaeta sp. 2T2.1]